MADDATKAAGGGDPAVTPSGGRTASEFRDVADALRNRVDLFGKTLAAVATLGTTAVGLSKIGDLFPLGDDAGWAIAACVGLAGAALAAIGVAVRLMKVARPVFMSTDLAGGGELSDGERGEVAPVYAAAAKRFGYASLIGLSERERSLRKAALRVTGEAERARRIALADEVNTAIEQALARGQVVAIRRRATDAVSGYSWALYLVVICGLILFAAGTDKVSSDRTDRIATAKACADARKAGATAGELKRTSENQNEAKDLVCDAEAEKAPAAAKPPTAAVARAKITASLAAALSTCTALVTEPGDASSGPLATKDCDPVRAAVARMDPPAP